MLIFPSLSQIGENFVSCSWEPLTPVIFLDRKTETKRRAGSALVPQGVNPSLPVLGPGVLPGTMFSRSDHFRSDGEIIGRHILTP